jgi:hypothetical protein
MISTRAPAVDRKVVPNAPEYQSACHCILVHKMCKERHLQLLRFQGRIGALARKKSRAVKKRRAHCGLGRRRCGHHLDAKHRDICKSHRRELRAPPQAERAAHKHQTLRVNGESKHFMIVEYRFKKFGNRRSLYFIGKGFYAAAYFIHANDLGTSQHDSQKPLLLS